MVLMDEGEMAHAFDHLKMALEARPFNATLHKNMGSLMLELNRPEAAVHHYKWAARISPADPELHYVLGGALMKLNLYAEAVRSFAEAVKIKPDYKPAHLMLEVSRGRQKKTEITGVE
jgi:predicted Zn-dependent protease